MYLNKYLSIKINLCIAKTFVAKSEIQANDPSILQILYTTQVSYGALSWWQIPI